MKFSTLLAATTALLTGVNAIPRLMEVETPEICWRACFPEKPHCPPGWVSASDTLLLFGIVLTLGLQHAKGFGVSNIQDLTNAGLAYIY